MNDCFPVRNLGADNLAISTDEGQMAAVNGQAEEGDIGSKATSCRLVTNSLVPVLDRI